MNFKAALGISLAAHAALVPLRPPYGWAPSREALHTIEITYQPPEVVSRTSAQTLPRSAPRPRPASPAAVPDIKPAPVPAPANPPRYAQISKAPAPPLVAPWVQAEPTPSGVSEKGLEASSIPAEEFAILQYRRQIRDHLKSHLRYPSVWAKGSVRMLLELDSNGSLSEATILDSTDPRLAALALEGAQAANPYPAFPRELTRSKTRCEFLVQYRPE